MTVRSQIHTIPQRLKLAQLMTEQYTSSKMNDREFADHAVKVLGFAIQAHHVRYLREQFDIPVNAPAVQQTLIQRVEKLEAEMSDLRAKLGDLLK